jgi:hypothetical protein
LREEKVVLVLRVDVGDAPTVALHADGLLKAVDVERAVKHGEGGFGTSFESGWGWLPR